MDKLDFVKLKKAYHDKTEIMVKKHSQDWFFLYGDTLDCGALGMLGKEFKDNIKIKIT